ncbi:PREDICTED: protein LURP-one-related 4-like isoform X1 [Populus euphratica]|uniref:Protein LURP-one-related 4-like isoform X1 n=1 Tax=Populus euphratica TaxID=75702 RepID=A0AAJ6U4L3_POPEU|nr:PREDICTED: protein LURP-one-related 4-like isoform X1 [Populus euphratica]
MAKVFPHSQRSVLDPFVSSERETFTIWMKSLVCQANGCTVFDSSGDIVYRIDNYDKKCSSKVYLMDLQGRVLVTIRRKRLQIVGCWYGYRWNPDANEGKPWFQVKTYGRLICMGSFACQVTVGFDKYWVVKLGSKQAFRIVNIDREVIAEIAGLMQVKQKRLSSGISLGDDVLTLVVEPHIDHSLIMAIVTVYGLINDKL